MELLVPQSLTSAISKSNGIEFTVDDVVHHIGLVLKFISKYEGKHGYVPTEWSEFKSNLASVLSKLTVLNKENFMSKVQSVSIETKRLQWTLAIINGDSSFSESQLRSFSMVELRDLYEEMFPSTITSYSATATGGVSKKVTVLKKTA